MQTFAPYPDIKKSTESLDYRRLGKQRVETLQILNRLLDVNKAANGKTPGWNNHPAVRMWRGNEYALAIYGLYMCQEWISRGYSDTCYDKISNLIRDYDLNNKNTGYPSWWGREDVHHSHRMMLIKKVPEFYGFKFPTEFEIYQTLLANDEEESIQYVWPV